MARQTTTTKGLTSLLFMEGYGDDLVKNLTISTRLNISHELARKYAKRNDKPFPRKAGL